MKLLLDENLPKRLKQDLQDFEVFTVQDKEWTGKSNGELIRLMMAEHFDGLITFDRNLEHQQNFRKFPITVFVLNAPDNTYQSLRRLVPALRAKFSQPLTIGVTEVKL